MHRSTHNLARSGRVIAYTLLVLCSLSTTDGQAQTPRRRNASPQLPSVNDMKRRADEWVADKTLGPATREMYETCEQAARSKGQVEDELIENIENVISGRPLNQRPDIDYEADVRACVQFARKVVRDGIDTVYSEVPTKVLRDKLKHSGELGERLDENIDEALRAKEKAKKLYEFVDGAYDTLQPPSSAPYGADLPVYDFRFGKDGLEIWESGRLRPDGTVAPLPAPKRFEPRSNTFGDPFGDAVRRQRMPVVPRVGRPAPPSAEAGKRGAPQGSTQGTTDKRPSTPTRTASPLDQVTSICSDVACQ